MQNGVMQLLQEEIQEAVNCLPDVSKFSSVCYKLNSAIDLSYPRVGIQFDTEELELLLDSLGAPLIEDPPVKKSLRKKIQTFLFFIRNEKLVIK